MALRVDDVIPTSVARQRVSCCESECSVVCSVCSVCFVVLCAMRLSVVPAVVVHFAVCSFQRLGGCCLPFLNFCKPFSPLFVYPSSVVGCAVVVLLVGWLLCSRFDSVLSSGSAFIVSERLLLFLCSHFYQGCRFWVDVGCSGFNGVLLVVFSFPYLYAGPSLLFWEVRGEFLFTHIGFLTACSLLVNSGCGLLVGCYVWLSSG